MTIPCASFDNQCFSVYTSSQAFQQRRNEVYGTVVVFELVTRIWVNFSGTICNSFCSDYSSLEIMCCKKGSNYFYKF